MVLSVDHALSVRDAYRGLLIGWLRVVMTNDADWFRADQSD